MHSPVSHWGRYSPFEREGRVHGPGRRTECDIDQSRCAPNARTVAEA